MLNRIHVTRTVAVGLLSLVALGACGDDSSTSDTTAAPATTAAGVAPDMSGVTLRAGYSLGRSKSRQALRLESGVFDGTPYKIEWSEFPQQDVAQQALNAGEIDVVVDVMPPNVIAQQANAAAPWTPEDAPFSVIAAFHYLTEHGVQIVVREDSGITSVEQLKGKKVAFTKGSTSQYFWVLASREAGLEDGDVEIAELTLADALAAFGAGAVDALVAFDMTAVPMVRGMGAKVIASAGDDVPLYSFMIGRRGLQDDAALAAAAGDFASRGMQFVNWESANRTRTAELLVELDKVDPADATAIAELGARQPTRLDGAVIRDTQAMADTFATAGVVPTKVDVAILFGSTLPVVYPPGTP